MADLPFAPFRPELADRLVAALDVAGKIARALATLGPLEGADVVLLGDAPARAAELSAAGARVTVVPLPGGPEPVPDALVAELLDGLPEASADALVGMWSCFAAPSPRSVAAADRVLRAGGRLLVVQEYGRDDLDGVRGTDRAAELVRWSRRDGWYLGSGFRIRVVHAFWTTGDLAEAGELLEAAFGEAGAEAAARLRRPRVTHNVAVYHRTRPAA